MKTIRFAKNLAAVCLLGSSLMVLGGCEDKPAPKPAATAPAKTPTPIKPAAVEPVELDSIPSEEDFEEEAIEEVTADNLDEQLDSLEKEIQGEEGDSEESEE